MKSLRLLVVDDDRLIGEAIQEFAASLGHTAVYVNGGSEALTQFSKQEFDLVLLDRVMPGMDGLELAGKLRRLQQGGAWCPLIMLSGFSEVDEQIEALNAGCDDFLAKPINFHVLEAKIHAFRRTADLQAQISRKNRELIRLREAQEEEKRIAQHLMARLVRNEYLNYPGVQHMIYPASLLSGDLLLVCPSHNGDTYVMLADATGHGLPAAITLIPLSQTFYAMAGKGFQLASIAAELNQQNRQYNPVDRFVAAALAVFRPREHILEVWNGGIPPALLLSEDGQVLRTFASRNVPLGVLPAEEFINETELCQIREDAQLILYSDGLIEGCNPAGEQFGKQRLLDVFKGVAPKQRLEHLRRKAFSYLDGQPIQDDLSCLLLDCPMDLHSTGPELERQGVVAAFGQWHFSVSLGFEQLKHLDIVPLLVSWGQALGLDQRMRSTFNLVLSELISNALDHGVLELASSIKGEVDGFERYMDERGRRLQALQHGQIEVEVEQKEVRDGRLLQVTVCDSGKGFDLQTLTPPDPASLAYHGRGLQLIKALSQTLEIRGRGNEVFVELHCPGSTAGAPDTNTQSM
ncbi:ATP-binding SpoIIE family protein phosphatase [Atopomonas sediminilitoris]|uniref:ATP-binding SpoIIE family protein phosphatase n=1 Tax=Atopomonas sediminilitoris TaxID=2919919 RepID=UPI001F4DC0B7|nr:SpoIIE family protein phosphatase [Atopomonas sediminilitoris]MCJ8170077.1 SpoIIE family protein phosphatase [Atopomonas sediminilitoris]